MKMNVMMTMKVIVVRGAVVQVVVVHSVHVQAVVVQVVVVHMAVVQVVGVQLVGVHSVVVHSVGIKVVAVHLDAVQLVAVQDMENVQNHLQNSWKLYRQRLPNWIHGMPRDVSIAWIQHLDFSEVIFKLTQINTCTNRDQLSYPDKIQRRKGQQFRHINLISNSQLFLSLSSQISKSL